MKKNVLILLIAFIAGFQFSATAVDHTVQVVDDQFNPATLNVKVGDRVIWQLQPSAAMPHTVTSSWASSPDLTSSNPTFTHTFTNTGTFPYYCSYHGTLTSGMRGVVNVTSVTGIEDDKALLPLMQVYPNPARESIRVKLDISDTKPYQLTLTNLTGQTVSVVPGTAFKGVKEDGIKLDVNNLPAGLYFLRLISNDKIMDTRRLILTR